MSASVAKTSGSVSVTTSSTAILAANTSRRTLTIVNTDGTNPVSLAFTTSFGTAPTATANSGVKLAAGASFSIDGYSGAVAGIATGGTVVVTVLEV